MMNSEWTLQITVDIGQLLELFHVAIYVKIIFYNKTYHDAKQYIPSSGPNMHLATYHLCLCLHVFIEFH